MGEILRYGQEHESGLLVRLKAEPDWHAFTGAGTLGAFRQALLASETYICRCQGEVCGYLRALVDGFGIYVSELYVAPGHRKRGHGKALLETIRQAHPDQAVHVLSDADAYYGRLGCKRAGSVFQL